jgi:hypothetical protein
MICKVYYNCFMLTLWVKAVGGDSDAIQDFTEKRTAQAKALGKPYSEEAIYQP